MVERSACHSISTILGLLICAMICPVALCEPQTDATAESKKSFYYRAAGVGTMAVGSLTSLYGLVSVIGPPSGGDPCSEEGKSARKAGESKDDCWERVNRQSKEAKKRGYYILPTGIAISGFGWYLFKLGDDNTNVGLRLDSTHGFLALELNSQF